MRGAPPTHRAHRARGHHRRAQAGSSLSHLTPDRPSNSPTSCCLSEGPARAPVRSTTRSSALTRNRVEVLLLHIHSPATVPAFSITIRTPGGLGSASSSRASSRTPLGHVRLLPPPRVPADDVVAVETTADLIALAGVRTSAAATRAWCPRRSRTATSSSCSSPCRERPPQLPSRSAVSRSPPVSRSPQEVYRLTPMPGSARES